jgi:hypothetical protein
LLWQGGLTSAGQLSTTCTVTAVPRLGFRIAIQAPQIVPPAKIPPVPPVVLEGAAA